MPVAPECPRCGGLIPNNETPGEYPGALSRWDNFTEICSRCGVEESWLDLHNRAYREGGSPHLDPYNDQSRWVRPEEALTKEMIDERRAGD